MALSCVFTQTHSHGACPSHEMVFFQWHSGTISGGHTHTQTHTYTPTHTTHQHTHTHTHTHTHRQTHKHRYKKYKHKDKCLLVYTPHTKNHKHRQLFTHAYIYTNNTHIEVPEIRCFPESISMKLFYKPEAARRIG